MSHRRKREFQHLVEQFLKLFHSSHLQLQGRRDMRHQYSRSGDLLCAFNFVVWINEFECAARAACLVPCACFAVICLAGAACSRWELRAYQARSAPRWFRQRYSWLHGHRSSHERLLRFHRMLRAILCATSTHACARRSKSWGKKAAMLAQLSVEPMPAR